MEEKNTSSSTERFIPMTSLNSGEGIEIAPDLYSYTIQVVNVIFVGFPDRPNDWVLVDAGMPKSAGKIIEAAEERFGVGAKPKAIVLTHGHFDHVGGIMELVERWQVPVYAHPLEAPYLTGEKDYPEPDSTVQGGMVAKMSQLFPNESIDLTGHVQLLPLDGSVPHMPGWRWIHTPGHTEGHVSLFRDSDRALIAGDAFVTVKQESLYQVFTQELEISGPPRYLTTDWKSSKDSIERLQALQPACAITGHGIPVAGEWLSENLALLVLDFERIAKPDYGKYV